MSRVVDLIMERSIKDKIMDSTITVMKGVGSSDFSMRKVAATTGISLGNLQYHFKTKSDLFVGLVNRYLEECRELYNGYMESPLTKEGLRSTLKEILTVEIDDSDDVTYKILHTYLEAGGLADDVIKPIFTEINQFIFNYLSNTPLPANDHSINLACSLLLPYFHAFGDIYSQLNSTLDEIVNMLTESVSNLIDL